MDRPPPRDLSDLIPLYANEGITPAIRRAFVVYLASHNRPLHEVLSPVPRDISQDYERTFVGMTTERVEFVELLNVRDRLMTELPQTLDSNERQFLLSLVSNKPEWPLLNLAHLEQLPAIRWKLKNLNNLPRPILRNLQNRRK